MSIDSTCCNPTSWYRFGQVTFVKSVKFGLYGVSTASAVATVGFAIFGGVLNKPEYTIDAGICFVTSVICSLGGCVAGRYQRDLPKIQGNEDLEKNVGNIIHGSSDIKDGAAALDREGNELTNNVNARRALNEEEKKYLSQLDRVLRDAAADLGRNTLLSQKIADERPRAVEVASKIQTLLPIMARILEASKALGDENTVLSRELESKLQSFREDLAQASMLLPEVQNALNNFDQIFKELQAMREAEAKENQLEMAALKEAMAKWNEYILAKGEMVKLIEKYEKILAQVDLKIKRLEELQGKKEVVT